VGPTPAGPRGRLSHPVIGSEGIGMKLRSLLFLGIGFSAGVAYARRMAADDPEVVHGPLAERRSENPAVRIASSQAQRLAELATTASLEAIRRTRGAIRERLDDVDDDAAWG
jgi:hypothetical protein